MNWFRQTPAEGKLHKQFALGLLCGLSIHMWGVDRHGSMAAYIEHLNTMEAWKWYQSPWWVHWPLIIVSFLAAVHYQVQDARRLEGKG